MCIVSYSCDTIIMLCSLSLQLMYRHFNKQHVLMLHAVLFSLFQCASTIVTYMIILLQFDQSDKSENECSRNVTKQVT
jgi:predicted MFS family arabinose efflux permease